ncbi:MAG TPA: S4 domain-containing protein [Allosphingosinicella sp.]|nr:S4 domain-containing protein [Allosphingosinicella sp.]
MADSLRLDKFLWFARIAKTRALAQQLAGQGRIRLGGRLVDRAHAPVRVGDVLSFAQRGAVRVLRVEALPTRRGPPAEARALYTEIAEGGAETPLPLSAGEEGPAREAGGR